MNRIPFAVVLLCCACATAGAQTVYKYRLPDGSIVYTGETLPNAKLLGTVREPLPAQPVDGKRQAEMRREKDKATQSSNARLEALAAADAKVVAATKALEAAKARQAAGVEPEEGERVGTVSGGGRPRDAYLDRQNQLREAVNEAQRQLDRAYQELNAAR